MTITGTTKLLGVIGYPIEHSLSPVMHNAAIAALGVDYVYLAFPVKPAEFETAIAGLGASGVQGFNLTIPHKQLILPLLHETSEIAQAVGAVNTVWRTESGWHGTNTDVEGFLAPLQHLKRNWSQATATVLGNGGAARAVVAACTQLGFKAIHVVGRNPEKLQQFQLSWVRSPLTPPLSVYPWESLSIVLPQTTVLVNTTPIGMHPHVDQSPIREADMALLPPEAIAYDLIYTPRPTKFLEQSAKQGLKTLDGLAMLVQQGAAALRIWLQQDVPVDVMERSLGL